MLSHCSSRKCHSTLVVVLDESFEEMSEFVFVTVRICSQSTNGVKKDRDT